MADTLLAITALEATKNLTGSLVVTTTYAAAGGRYLIEVYNNEEDARVCQSFLLLPGENVWDPSLRTFLYLIFLLWCFMGVSIIADVFMQSIEVITSQTKKVTKEDGEEVDEVVWNATVANLSLMALGSSAPEILLSCIETISNLGDPAGEMGAATIVGSAAFNLLFISAVCVGSIPDGGVKKIKDTGVYAATAFASVWAYIWLLLVLSVISPNVVETWEAILTFLQFPILVVVAYLLDRRGQKQRELATSKTQLSLKLAEGDTDGVQKILEEREEQTHNSAMMYRINASRSLVGGKRMLPPSAKAASSAKVSPYNGDELEVKARTAIIQLESELKPVMENIGQLPVKIIRCGVVNNAAQCRVFTVEGTAKAGEGKDFLAVDTTVNFEAGETEKVVNVTIIDNNTPDPDRRFFVNIESLGDAKVGHCGIMIVTINDDDVPGVVRFGNTDEIVKEDAGVCNVLVVREKGCHGAIKVEYATRHITADENDYEPVKGTLVFADKEVEKIIPIKIINDSRYEEDETFAVELTQSKADDDSATVGELGDVTQLVIIIQSDDKLKGLFSNALNRITQKKKHIENFFDRGYNQQFIDAMTVAGDEENEPSTSDYVLHFLAIFWKVLFALVPPPNVGGGWPCFGVALAFIGGLTAVIGDVAAIFGCTIGLSQMLTGITFVALGTSLPDTFASKAAAQQAPNADAAIGNITGSNAVNVFLGLGLPWVIATLWSESQPGSPAYQVPEGSLQTSVIVFSSFAVLSIFILFVRRMVFGGELGGPTPVKIATSVFFVTLWILYVYLSATL